MPASALAIAADAALRVASLNLCTDEMLLLLAEPRQIVSLSHLSHSPRETRLWQAARQHSSNNGKLEGVLAKRPQLILTMGASGSARAALARRFGARLVELPYPANPQEVIEQAGLVARLVGRPAAALPFRKRLAQLAASRPRLEQGAFLSGGGLSIAAHGLGADWLALAGFRQPAMPNQRLSLEQLASSPPRWLIRSDYRADQESRASSWLRHPLVTRLGDRTIVTDGRPWTCGGLPMLAEVARLREARRAR